MTNFDETSPRADRLAEEGKTAESHVAQAQDIGGYEPNSDEAAVAQEETEEEAWKEKRTRHGRRGLRA